MVFIKVFLGVLISGLLELLIGGIILTGSIIIILEISWLIDPPKELEKTIITGVYAQIILIMYMFISTEIGNRFISWAIKKIEIKYCDTDHN